MTVAYPAMIHRVALALLASAFLITGCSEDSSAHADQVPVDIPPGNSHDHLYAPGSDDPTSYRQTITDRAYNNDAADASAPGARKSNPPSGPFDQ